MGRTLAASGRPSCATADVGEAFEASGAADDLRDRNRVPELERLVELLIATSTSGNSVAPRLRRLAAGWRQDRLRTIQADAGRAGETMFVPVMLGILVALMVLVVAPGAAAFIRLLIS